MHDVEGHVILYTNIDQFLNKRDDSELTVAGNEPDIILITEILPKAHCNTLTSSRLSLNGYSFVLNFDPDGTPPSSVRGVGIYVSKRLSFCEVHFDSYNCIEHIWVKVTLRGQDSLLVGCIYRSPSTNPHQSTTELRDLLVSLQGYSHVLILITPILTGHYCHAAQHTHKRS